MRLSKDNTRGRLPGLLLASLMAAVAISGCGGGSSATGSTTASGPPLTKPQFIHQADRICSKIAGRYTSGSATYSKEHPGASESEIVSAVAVPVTRTVIGELHELAPPKGEEAKVAAMLEGIEAGIDGLEKDPGQKINGATWPFNQINKTTAAYGFRWCTGF